MTVQLESQPYLAAGATGALAGTVACVAQTLVGVVLNTVLLPPGHDNNIAPRLVHHSARKAGHHTPPAVDWLLGTLFHVGYGIGWGAFSGWCAVGRAGRVCCLAAPWAGCSTC